MCPETSSRFRDTCSGSQARRLAGATVGPSSKGGSRSEDPAAAQVAAVDAETVAAPLKSDHAIGLQQVKAHENDGDQRHPNGCPAHSRIPAGPAINALAPVAFHVYRVAHRPSRIK